MDPVRQTALVLIDIQKGVVPPAELELARSTPDLEQNVGALLKAFRDARAPIMHVKHHSKHRESRLHPMSAGVAFLPFAGPLMSETVITKSTNSAFIDTKLAALLKGRNIRRLVFCGMTTDHCVSTTVRAASDLDIVPHAYGVSGVENPMPGRIVLVSDASAMFDTFLNGKKYEAQLAHELALAHLQGEFCDIESTQEVISKLLEAQASLS